MKKDNTTLLVIGCLSAALLLFRKQSPRGVGRLFGGNSGYIDYSMSKRAAEARTEGRYPKTDFKRVYGISNDNVLNTLVQLGIINNREWHHTSKFGNQTTFYSWNENGYADIYKLHKTEINKLIRNGDISTVEQIFADNIEPYLQEEQRQWEAELAAWREEQARMEIARKREEQRRNSQPDIFTASNGAIVVKSEGNAVYLNGERLTKRNKKGMRDEALMEMWDYLKSIEHVEDV